MLVISIFSFSNIVFQSLLLRVIKSQNCVVKQPVEKKIVEKGKNVGKAACYTSPTMFSTLLTLHYEVPCFDNDEKEAFLKYCAQKRKCGYMAFSPFLTMFSPLSNTKIII